MGIVLVKFTTIWGVLWWLQIKLHWNSKWIYTKRLLNNGVARKGAEKFPCKNSYFFHSWFPLLLMQGFCSLGWPWPHSSCLSIMSVEITGMNYHVWLKVYLRKTPLLLIKYWQSSLYLITVYWLCVLNAGVHEYTHMYPCMPYFMCGGCGLTYRRKFSPATT